MGVNFNGNRGSILWKNAIKKLTDDSDTKTLIIYYCTDKENNESFEKNKNVYDRIIKPLDDSFTWKISDKYEISNIFLNSDILPRTYIKKGDVLSKYSKDPEKIWFIKHRGSTAGKNVFCYKTKDIFNTSYDSNFVYQEGVMNIDTLNAKKYIIRCYILIWNKSLYLHQKAFTIIHGMNYNQTSTDLNIQVNHEGYDRVNGKVQLAEFKDDIIFQNIVKGMRENLKNFDKIISKTSRDSFILLGPDVIVQKDKSIKLIEINRYPNIVHTQEINEKVNQLVIDDCASLLVKNKNKYFTEIK